MMYELDTVNVELFAICTYFHVSQISVKIYIQHENNYFIRTKLRNTEEAVLGAPYGPFT